MSAGAIIGRIGCPWCGFEGAHVKQADAKHPYHHCPTCGMLSTCRNGLQAQNMRQLMRPVTVAQTKADDAPPPRRPDATPPPAAPASPPPEPPKPAKRASAWAPLLGVLK